jgi:hypothetical protein
VPCGISMTAIPANMLPTVNGMPAAVDISPLTVSHAHALTLYTCTLTCFGTPSVASACPDLRPSGHKGTERLPAVHTLHYDASKVPASLTHAMLLLLLLCPADSLNPCGRRCGPHPRRHSCARHHPRCGPPRRCDPTWRNPSRCNPTCCTARHPAWYNCTTCGPASGTSRGPADYTACCARDGASASGESEPLGCSCSAVICCPMWWLQQQQHHTGGWCS